MRSILLHLEDRESMEARFQAALGLAHATNGHLTCLHVTPVDPFITYDGLGGLFVMGNIMEALDQQGDAIKAEVEERLQREDVSWDFQQLRGSLPYTLLSHASLADVVVAGRPTPRGKSGRPAIGLLADLVLGLRSPLLVPGVDATGFDPCGKAMIAWNGSQEAANAVRGALSLLRLAASIDVLEIEEERGERHFFPSTRLLEYLSRHDLHAELTVETRGKQPIDAMLVAFAQRIGASCIILGGYGHSRIGEYVFGGVTRTMLCSSPVNLVIAH